MKTSSQYYGKFIILFILFICAGKISLAQTSATTNKLTTQPAQNNNQDITASTPDSLITAKNSNELILSDGTITKKIIINQSSDGKKTSENKENISIQPLQLDKPENN